LTFKPFWHFPAFLIGKSARLEDPPSSGGFLLFSRLSELMTILVLALPDGKAITNKNNQFAAERGAD